MLSWPVIGITSLWLVFANLVDTSTNGLGHVWERIAFVLGTQAVFYGALILSNELVLRRISSSKRWLALWITISLLAVSRGFLLAFIWLEVGLATELSPWSRAIAGLTNLAILMVFITIAYGMLVETGKSRRQLEAIHNKLITLKNEFIENRAAQNQQIIENVRKRLAAALSPELLNTPQQTIDSIRTSIDEVIRPLTRTLAQRTHVEEEDRYSQVRGIAIGKYLQRITNAREIQVLPGLILFALLMLTPLSNVLGPGKAPIIDVLISLQLFITTWTFKWLVLRFGASITSWSSPLILLASAGVGVLIFIPLMPTHFQLSFALGFMGVYLFCTLVPIALHVAVDESRLMSIALDKENKEFSWALARSNEVTQQQTKTIATALHGRLQASLAAAALRLQIAIQNGEDPAGAQVAARQEAEKAIAFDVDVYEESTSLTETISEISELWNGVCDVLSQSDESVLSQIDQDPVCSRLCSELVMELCTNAIKHGKANNINISLSFESPRVVKVQISNDGTVYDSNSPGYGTQLLDQSCINWSQQNHNGLTVITALAPWAIEKLGPQIPS